MQTRPAGPEVLGLRFIVSPEANTIRPFPALIISRFIYKRAAPPLLSQLFHVQSLHLTGTRHRATLEQLQAAGDPVPGEVVWYMKTKSLARPRLDAMPGGAASECTKGH